MIPRVFPMSGWHGVPLPRRVIRLLNAGVPEILTGSRFSLDVRADMASDEVLVTLDLTALEDANGLRMTGATGLIPQIDAATMSATYHSLCQLLRVPAGGTASGVYDLRRRYPDGVVEIPLEGSFIIRASTTLP